MRWPADPDRRRRLCEALLDWVAALDVAEPRPAGVDPSAHAAEPDLFHALGEVEAVRREIALQGRAFRRLAESSAGVREQVEGLARDDERRRAAEEADARQGARLQVIEGLLATREGLQRSLQAARALRPSLVGRYFGSRARAAAFASLVRALEMNLETADGALRELDVRELCCEGDVFDPARMRAVEMASPAEGAPGTVVAVRRCGWVAGERILRPAEVRAVPAAMGGATPQSRESTKPKKPKETNG